MAPIVVIVFALLVTLVGFGYVAYMLTSPGPAPAQTSISPRPAPVNPVDCKYSAWGDWSKCSLDCGGGQQVRNRTVLTQAKHGGKPCDGKLRESRDCNVQPCPVDCKYSAWGDWSKCSLDCGGGQQVRNRTVLTLEKHGGKSCDVRKLHEYRDCNTQPCPVTCTLSSWSNWLSAAGYDWQGWSPCQRLSPSDKKCHQKRTRTRKVLTPAQHGGAPCEGKLTDVETRECDCSMTFKEQCPPASRPTEAECEAYANKTQAFPYRVNNYSTIGPTGCMRHSDGNITYTKVGTGDIKNLLPYWKVGCWA